MAPYEFLALRLFNERNKATRASFEGPTMQSGTKARQAVYYVPSLITAYRSLLKLLRAPGSEVIVTDIERGNKEVEPMGFQKSSLKSFFFHSNFCDRWFFIIAQESKRSFWINQHNSEIVQNKHGKLYQYLLFQLLKEYLINLSLYLW